MDVRTSKRIVLLGKSGAGKSSLANTILGGDVFKINHTPVSETSLSRVETKNVSGKSLTLIDTLSLFDTCMSEKLLKAGIVRCITECAPGPHAFLIVLKVEKFTKQEKDVIKQIREHFSEAALKYATVVFTHGDQLPEGMKIEEFVSQNEGLGDLVMKCGGRCHVVDNKYWKDNKDNYRNNRFHVAQILDAVDKIFEANKGSCYTTEMLQAVKREIEREEEHIRQSSANVKRLSHEEIGNRAKISVYDRLLIRLAGMATGMLLGALFGVGVTGMVTSSVASAAQSGVVRGGLIGYDAAEGAETPGDAVQRAAGAVWNSTKLNLGAGAAPLPNNK